jgi:hypothetical protein
MPMDMVRVIGVTSAMIVTSIRIERIGTSTHRMPVKDWRMIINFKSNQYGKSALFSNLLCKCIGLVGCCILKV